MKRFSLTRLVLIAVCLLAAVDGHAEGSVALKARKQWLNIPVSGKAERGFMKITAGDRDTIAFVVRLAPGEPDYWVSCDISSFSSKKIQVSYDGNPAGLDRLTQTDGMANDAADIYREEQRPQQHFTFRRGWNNDPNGMIYHDGVYHLFGQHNPYENDWENMHWGHAVSTDLIHWTELPEAFAPGTDRAGIFSGTVVADKDNTAGFAAKGQTALVAFYTLNRSDHEVQNMAYSLDGGLTWTQYEGNPIIDSYDRWQCFDLRDPKVFWYAPGEHWVMVLYERNGHSFYSSDDLKSWTYNSHIEGFFECPDIYELPVQGRPGETRWVLSGASGAYVTGSFDGKVFTPDGSRRMLFQGQSYAGQTFNDFPGGRVVQILWDRVWFGDTVPFRSMFSTPLEMTLRDTPYGVRMYAEPVAEFEVLQHQVFKGESLSPAQAAEALNNAGSRSVRVKGAIHQDNPVSTRLTLGGRDIYNYDISWSEINGKPYEKTGSPLDLSFDIIVDSASFEAALDGGARFVTGELPLGPRAWEFHGDRLTVTSLEVYTLDSIWR